MRESVQVGRRAPKTCPCFGVLCFLCAFITSLFGSRSASADTPVAALQSTPLAAPAAVLGLTNPYVVAAALKRPAIEKPKLIGFTLSRDLMELVQRVENLAVDGVALNQRKFPQADKLNLRVQSRLGGGVVQLRYRR